ncbi:MAG: YciI family protein [Pseudomonadota bacterium]
MLFSIVTYDAPGSEAKRQELRDVHLTHFLAQKEKVALSGHCLNADGTSAGSLIVFHAESLAEAKAFIEADPFYPAGVWRDVTISVFNAKIVNPALLNQE